MKSVYQFNYDFGSLSYKTMPSYEVQLEFLSVVPEVRLLRPESFSISCCRLNIRKRRNSGPWFNISMDCNCGHSIFCNTFRACLHFGKEELKKYLEIKLL